MSLAEAEELGLHPCARPITQYTALVSEEGYGRSEFKCVGGVFRRNRNLI